METDMKTDVLLDVTAATQQHESLGTTRLQSFVTSMTTQALLAETPTCTDQQRVKWSKAARELLTTLLAQMSSSEVSICQAACCLASAALRSCSVSIFVEHYSAFTLRALDLVRKQTLTHSPHMWSVIAAAFNRIEQLVHLPGLRREASSLAPKLMALLQPTLTATGSVPHASGDRLSLELLQGLNAGLQALPTAFRAHQKALGEFAAALLATPLLPTAVRGEAARTFSLLPRLTGDAEAWSSYTQNVLCACHSRLDIAYLGMDDSALAASAKAALDPAAQPLMPSIQDLNLAQHSTAGQPSRPAGQSMRSVAAVEAALGQLAGFLDALERLLTVSFSVAVPLPAYGILMLLTRVLSFDDSARQAGQAPPSVSAYLALSAALPALHSCALQLVQTLLWTGQGSLLPHYAPMARMMCNALRHIAAAPAPDPAPTAALLRQQVYKTASEVMGRGGVGAAALLGPQAVPCALLELYGCKQSKKRPLEEGLPNGHPPKKQKKSKTDNELPSFESMMDNSNGSSVTGAEAQQQHSSHSLDSSSAGAQEAALQLLQSLLQAWGSGMTQQQRMQIDAVTAHIASTASTAAHHMSQSFEDNCNQAQAIAVHLAALKALLASILAPAPHRPSFLPQALALFTQGLQSPTPDIAHFSQQALLSIEGIMHPRAGHTILPPRRHTPNPHPYLSASAAELTELGMPRLWSALAPDACTPRQTHGTATTAADNSQQLKAKAAGQAMAQEMLQAGRLCSAAAAKLQAALDGSGAVCNGQPAAHAADHHPHQQRVDNSHGGHDPTTAVAASPEAALAAAAPVGSLHVPKGSLDSPSRLVSSIGKDIPVIRDAQKSAAGNYAHDGINPRPELQPASQQATVRDAMLTDGADDGYISLGHQPGIAGKADAGKQPAADLQIPQTVEGYIAGAESSDSQGSLPEIDSGESSDSSSS